MPVPHLLFVLFFFSVFLLRLFVACVTCCAHAVCLLFGLLLALRDVHTPPPAPPPPPTQHTHTHTAGALHPTTTLSPTSNPCRKAPS